MLLRALLAFLALPGIVAIAVPAWVTARALQRGEMCDFIALLPLLAGFALLLWCVRDFYVAGKGTLAIYTCFVIAAFHLRVSLHEEPFLAHTHGAAWEEYRSRVPRWLI